MVGTIIVLLVAATAVAMVVQRLKLPYTVALVLAGLGLGAMHGAVPGLGLEQLRLTPDLLFGVFLPVLLFEAAFHLSWRKFKKNLRAILLLAVPGVAVAIGLAGILAWFFEPWAHVDLPLVVALLLMSMLAATDPVSVIALFKELGVPKRLMVLMEGESLLNDGVAVVVFMAIAAVLGLHHTGGEEVTAGWVTTFFLWEVGLGIVIGVVVGLLVSYLMTLVEDHLVEIMLSTLAAFGSYVIADAIHASFVLAVVAAGMACGNVGVRYGVTPTNYIAVESFWEYAVFVANSMVFLLLGKEIDLSRLAERAVPILIAFAVLMLARALVIFGVTGALLRTRERLPARWPAVLVWGGLRGSLSMVLALSLPESFPQRELLVDLVFGVVLLSILVQGLSMAPLLKWAGVVGGGAEKLAYMRIRGAMRATRKALGELDLSMSRGDISEQTHELLRERLGGRLAELEQSLGDVDLHEESLRADELRRTKEKLLETEREAIRSAQQDGLVTPSVAKSLLKEIDQREIQLDELVEEALRRERHRGEPEPAEAAPPGGGE